MTNKNTTLEPVFKLFEGEYPQYLGFYEFKDKFDAHFDINRFLELNNCEVNDKIELDINNFVLESMTMPDILKHISSRILFYVVDKRNVVYNLDHEDVEIHDVTFYLHKIFEDELLKNKVLVDFTIKNAVVKESADFKYKQIHYATRKYLEEQQSNQILANKNIKPFLNMTIDEFNDVADTGFIEPSVVKAIRSERTKNSTN
jgi:hypothetical protein